MAGSHVKALLIDSYIIYIRLKFHASNFENSGLFFAIFASDLKNFSREKFISDSIKSSLNQSSFIEMDSI